MVQLSVIGNHKSLFELKSTKKLINMYEKDIENNVSLAGQKVSRERNNVLIRHRGIKFQEFQGVYIHENLVYHLAISCNLRYAITVSNIMKLMYKEVFTRNINYETQINELNEKINELTLKSKENDKLIHR